MVSFVVAIVVGYFIIQFAGYCVHRALHHPALGKIHKTHDVHHFVIYPADKYLDTGKYKDVPDESQPFKYYAAAAVPLIITTYFLFPMHTFIALTLELCIVAWLNDWLHQKLHIKGFWLERYSWFHRMRELHWHHHFDISKNIGIFSWHADKVVGTFEEPRERPPYLD